MNPRMIGLVGALALLFVLAAPAAAGPPFGGDDTGCVPDDSLEWKCGAKITQLLGYLQKTVIKCHIVQEQQAFKTGHSSPGFDAAEENCEIGPSNTAAKAKFDAYLAKLAVVCDPALIANAEMRRDALLAGAESLDALNGSFFCDDSSGLTIAEPDGDDAGFIPATEDAEKCARKVAGAYRTLVNSVYKCHGKMGKYVFYGKPFDEDACEDAPPPPGYRGRSALARYNLRVMTLIALGICPPCLAEPPEAPAAIALGANAVAAIDAQNVEIFPCP